MFHLAGTLLDNNTLQQPKGQRRDERLMLYLYNFVTAGPEILFGCKISLFISLRKSGQVYVKQPSAL